MAGALKRRLSEWDKLDLREEVFHGWEPVDELEVVQQANDEWAATTGADDSQHGDELSFDRCQADTGIDGGARSDQPIVICEVQSFTSDMAYCLADVAGARLPVEIPIWALQPHELQVGMHFEWRMSEDGSIYPMDIKPSPSPRLPPAKEEVRQRLWQEYLEDPGTDVWTDSAK